MRPWAVAADVLLASLGFSVFIWGDLTTQRGLRAGGVVLVTLAFLAGANHQLPLSPRAVITRRRALVSLMSLLAAPLASTAAGIVPRTIEEH